MPSGKNATRPAYIPNMSLRFVFASLLGFASLATVACGAGGEPDAPTDAPYAATAETLACARFAQAKCARALACDPTYDSYAVRPSVACESSEAGRCLERVAPGSGLTVEALDACTAALPTAACGRLSPVTLPEACAPVRGQLPEGSACRFKSQCASGVCLAEVLKCGVCVEGAGEGTPCDPVKSACAEGLVCDLVKNVCKPIIRVGQPCEEIESLRCESGVCRDGTCREPLVTGEACDEKKSLCAFGHRCEKGVCQPMTIEAASRDVGQSCGSDAGNAMCRIGAYCVFPNQRSLANGKCEVEGVEGEPCKPQGIYGNGCADGYACASGVCRRVVPSSCR